MDILSLLSDQGTWQAFLNKKTEQGNLPERELLELKEFIDTKQYIPLVQHIQNGGTLSPPKQSLISKTHTAKKRIVYTFRHDENYLLKLITFLLRDYDDVFAPNLYSFRKNHSVKQAVNKILNIRRLDELYVYKVDISDYFNSVDISLLLPKLQDVLQNDMRLYTFIKKLLECPYAEIDGKPTRVRKGIMAGVPLSTFLANLYLKELDFIFFERNIPYMRYSDDIIVFAENETQLNECIVTIKSFLSSHNLSVNDEKENIYLPKQSWNFLGFSYSNGIVDISDISFNKLKAKIRRKTRALSRWARKKGVSGERAAKALIKRFNAKFYDNPTHNELTWSRWFFPIINTDRTLKQIDAYMCECVRYLATGKRTKAKYNFRYEDIKTLGFKSLVNAYYDHKNTEASDN